MDNVNSRFAFNPEVNVSRSSVKRPVSYKTTFNTGDLIPIYCDPDIIPGTTVTMDMASLVRMSTPIFPVCDNAWIDFYWFFTPNRLVWKHFEQFCGASDDPDWSPAVEYEIPQISPSSSSSVHNSNWTKGTLADYFGLPTDVGGYTVSALPFRAYCMIYNEWFRASTIQSPLFFPTGDATEYAFPTPDSSGNYSYVTSTYKGLRPAKVNRFHDYFSSALPQPQRGAPIEIGLLTSKVPVGSTADRIDTSNGLNSAPIHFKDILPSDMTGLYNLAVDGETNNMVVADPVSGQDASGPMYIDNLYADMSSALVATVNELRQAFALQTLLERDARGSRYRELLYNHFGVDNSDARMQIPEYLGGKRVPINIDQVVQSSASTDVSPIGSTSGFSLTTDNNPGCFTKSFTEHGILMCLACVRTARSYQQGIPKSWSKKKRFDFYYPVLANLGEQPILRKEIYATGYENNDERVFGYQEAWSEYRYSNSIVTSAFRSNYAQSLDSWHYADYYTEAPVLNAEWLNESYVNVDRTLAVQSSVEDQFIGDFAFDATYVQPIPLYSIPGLNISHY